MDLTRFRNDYMSFNARRVEQNATACQRVRKLVTDNERAPLCAFSRRVSARALLYSSRRDAAPVKGNYYEDLRSRKTHTRRKLSDRAICMPTRACLAHFFFLSPVYILVSDRSSCDQLWKHDSEIFIASIITNTDTTNNVANDCEKKNLHWLICGSR